MRVFGGGTNTGMAIRQQQRGWVADASTDDAEVHGGVEQAGIPALPLRKDRVHPLLKRHGVECAAAQ